MLRNIILACTLCFSFALGAQTFSISGTVMDRFDEPVGSMTIDLLDAAGAVIATQNVDCDGLYSFDGLEAGVDYSLRPDKQGSWFNGVSTFDLVLISKHILGVDPIDDFYQIAAADINESGSVTVLDILLAQALPQDFPGANWLFFRPGDMQASATFPFTLGGDLTDFDFVTIKKGDVNGSAVNCE